MHPIRILSGILLTSTLVACATTNAENEWIELELTENTYYSSMSEIRKSSYEILVPANSWIEYMVAMKEGHVITYNWDVEMENPELLTAEFHGHTEKQPDQPGQVMFYKKHNSGEEQGTLVAPFDGPQGWYLKNDSDSDIYLDLSIAGFFSEIEQKEKE